MFSSTYELNLDLKHRLSIPSGVRTAMDPERDGTAFYIVLGNRRKTLFLFPDKAFERYANDLHERLVPSEQKDHFETMFYANATLSEIDKQNRIVIPQRIMDQVGLGRQVVLSGKRDHLVLWDQQAFSFYMDEYLPRYHDMLLHAERQSQQVNQSVGH